MKFVEWIKEGNPQYKQNKDQLRQTQEDIRQTREAIGKAEARLVLLVGNRSERGSLISTSQREEASLEDSIKYGKEMLAKLLEQEAVLKKI